MHPRMLKMLCDSVQQLPMCRADVQTGVFARQLVTETLNELFRHQFEEAKWADGTLMPINTSLNEGATEYSFVEVQHVGRAKIVADNATDIPRSDVKGQQSVLPVKTVACSFEYSTQEIRTAQMQGLMDMPTEKSMAAREGHDYALNDFIRDGVAAAGLLGATTAPGIIVHTATTGDWGNPATTPAQIVTDFTTAANLIMEQSSGVEVPNTAVFPIGAWTRITTTQNSTASDITVLEFLRKAFPQITEWTWDAGLGTSAMIYSKDPRKMRAVVPMMLRPLPPVQKGLVFEVTLESRFGGVMVPRPRSVLRLDGVLA